MKVNQHIIPRGESPKLHIKQVARRLFAERGLQSVTVREIALAADQKNQGVVAYYFGTKDVLVREILTDGAEKIEVRRAKFLDELEAGGGPHTVEEAVAAIVIPSARFAEEDAQCGRYFNRFLYQISTTNSELVDKTLEGRWNQGYQRCLSHLRRLLVDINEAEQNRRFLFLNTYAGGLLAQRDLMMADTNKEHPMWRSEALLEDIVRCGAALLEAPRPGDS